MAVIWVALGGACGAVLRFGVSRALVGTSLSFPLATLAVNVLGSFVIGLLAASFLSSGVNSAVSSGVTGGAGGEKIVPGARLFFQTGLLGAFTTFSAFSLETLNLWQSGQNKAALINVLANVVLSLLAVTLGMIVGSALAARLR